MKKTMGLLLVLALSLAVFAGCTQAAQQADIQEKRCRVEGLEENAMFVFMSDVGYVRIQCEQVNLELKQWDTVVVEFSESDLKQETGTYRSFAGAEQEYTYVLTQAKSMRHPQPGEPTFG